MDKQAFQALIDEVHQTAVEHGWWADGRDKPFPELIALLHSEVSEVFESWRSGTAPTSIVYTLADDSLNYSSAKFAGYVKPDGIPVELADVIIRAMDMAAGLGIPLAQAMEEKLAYNKTRSYRHGGKMA